jgi:dipeptidyl aminopeptidase/acylaminoacyl peptidase
MTRSTLFSILLLAALVAAIMAVFTAGCTSRLNSTTQSPTPPASSPTAESAAATQPATVSQTQSLPYIAHIRLNGNVFLFDPATGRIRQVTGDATPFGPLPETAAETVLYSPGKWSSDGRLLAFERQHGRRDTGSAEAQFEYDYSLWVYDATSNQSRLVLEGQQANGFAWQPGSHLIAYGLPVPSGYFTSEGEPSPELASGIMAVDADSGETRQLVKPERGFTLADPQWAPNSQIVAFDELDNMEGQGSFAYYDLAGQKYVAWNTVIGAYQWTPDSLNVVYDTLTGTPAGDERIFIRPREKTAAIQLSPDGIPGFSHSPAVSLQGDRLAYITDIVNADSEVTSKLYVQPLQGGQPRELGDFEKPSDLAWSSDGQSLLLSSGGSYEERQVLIVSLADGSQSPALQGVFPSWQPVVPTAPPTAPPTAAP